MRQNSRHFLLSAVAVMGLNKPGTAVEFSALLKEYQSLAKTFETEASVYNRAVLKRQESFIENRQMLNRTEDSLPADLVLEFKIRGLSQRPITQSDLERVAINSRLVDEALWKVIHEKSFSLFKGDAASQKSFSWLASFIKKQDSTALFSQKHGFWWRYFTTERIEDLEALPDLEFQAFVEFRQARNISFPLLLTYYLQTRSKLESAASQQEYLSDFDSSLLSALLQHYQPRYSKMLGDIEAAVSNQVTGVNNVKIQEQKIRLYQRVVEVLRAQKKFYWAVEAKLKMVELSERLAINPRADEILQVADDCLEAERFKDGLVFLRNHQEKFETAEQKGEVDYRMARFYEGLANQNKPGTEKGFYLEWAAEHYRKALNALLMTENRDTLLSAYAHVLGELGLKNAQMSVLEALFRGGSVKEDQIAALVMFLKESVLRVDLEKDPTNKGKLLGKHLSLLAQFARAHPMDPSLNQLFSASRNSVYRAKLNEKPEIIASLFEVQNVLDNVASRLRSKPPSTTRKKKAGRGKSKSR